MFEVSLSPNHQHTLSQLDRPDILGGIVFRRGEIERRRKAITLSPCLFATVSQKGEKKEQMGKSIKNHWELDVYKMSVESAMKIYEITKGFPKEEKYSLTDQIRRSSRAVSANVAEAWRRRRYRGNFISRMNDAEAEAAETQVWIEYAVKCDYIENKFGKELHQEYDNIIGKIVIMINNPDDWTIGEHN